MISLATVGTSKITEQFLEGLALSKNFTLKSVYSRSFEKGKAFAEKYGCQEVYTNLEEMAKSGIDAVYIASPNVLHEEQSALFLENGVHVLCEKPIALSESGFARLKKLADSKHLIYMEAILSYYTKKRKDIKEALLKIGPISHARISYLQRSSKLDAFLRGEHVNIFDMKMGTGSLMDLGIYPVYGCVDLLGMPKNITSFASYFENGADKAGTSVLEYDGFTASVTYSKAGQSYLGSEIAGENGTLKIGMISEYSSVSLFKDGKETIIVPKIPKSELMNNELEAFGRRILHFEEEKEDYEESSKLCDLVHQCMDKIKKSAGIHYPERL